MTTRQRHLPDADAIADRISAIEGGSTSFELLSRSVSRRREAAPLCALVRSIESRRVYLLVHESEPASGWQPPCEIIGFDGLRGQLRMRRPAAKGKGKTAGKARRSA
ncbi:MAG TPA: hypothetical protein VGQ90_11345 [Stellaceae bacterium]|nr:hypothetical protein [Stellaceae bacterium]